MMYKTQSVSGVRKERCRVHILYNEEEMVHSQESCPDTKQSPHQQRCFYLCNFAQHVVGL